MDVHNISVFVLLVKLGLHDGLHSKHSRWSDYALCQASWTQLCAIFAIASAFIHLQLRMHS